MANRIASLPQANDESGEDLDFAPHSHDLEAHLDGLRQLDKARQRSAELRSEAVEALAEMMNRELAGDAAELKELYGIAALRASWLLRESKNINATNAAASRLQGLAALGLDDIYAHKYSVLYAAEVLQALSLQSKVALSRATFVCWYWIIRELFTASNPDWIIGGARATHDGHVTAYSTLQCTQAVLDYARSVDATGNFFLEIAETVDHLKKVEDERIPESWRDVEKKRLCLATRRNLMLLSEQIAVDIFEDSSSCVALEGYLSGLPHKVRKAMISVRLEVRAAHREIKNFLDEKQASIKNADNDELRKLLKRQFYESQSGSTIALAALERTSKDACEVVGKLYAAGVGSRRKREWNDPELWRDLSRLFKEAAKRVHDGIRPASRYFASVIDRQLSAASSGLSRDRDPSELAFAAVGLQALSDHPKEHEQRLLYAAESLCGHIAPDGTIGGTKPFHVFNEGRTASVSKFTTIGAISELLRLVRLPLNVALATKTLAYIEITRADRSEPKCGKKGWAAEYAYRPRSADLRPTVYALFALQKINRMLDEGINNIILEHFSVRRAGDRDPDLGQLFYPDYGINKYPSHWLGNRESVAFVLQRMAWQVSKPKTSAADRIEPLRSLALYGPAGTGKTTLVEALAKTCNVPMVEVTPSDIAKSGEAAIERRARTVFETLAMLSRVVILFDEFDPVLRKREETGGDAVRFFSFLTPGMLPKLKNLNEKTKDRSSAYVLITNRIGTLDEAAMRKGRFDQLLGVFPPDPVSRYGRLMFLYSNATASALNPRSIPDEEQQQKFMKATGSLGMTKLSTNGWFRIDKKQGVPEGSPIGCLRDGKAIDIPTSEPEDPIPAEPRGSTPAGLAEFKQWQFLVQWEKALRKGKIEEWLDWPQKKTAKVAGKRPSKGHARRAS